MPRRNVTAEKVNALLKLALLEYDAGRLAEVERLCLQILALDVRHADTLYLLGMVGYRTERFEMAERMIRRAIAVNSRQAYYHFNLGNTLRALKRTEEAIPCYQRAMELKPDYDEAYYNLGNIYLSQNKLELAEAQYKQAIKLKPNYVDALCNLGGVYRKQERLDEAVEYFKRALALAPENADLYSNLGDSLHMQGKVEEAVALYKKTLSLNPKHIKALNCLCNGYFDLGDLAESVAWCERALAVKPDFNDALMNQCLLQLLQGDYVNGWRNYEVRWKVYAPRLFNEPLWLGAPLKGASIVLYAEQGLGDSLQFLRYVPLVQAAGGRVILDLPVNLRRLAAQIPGLAALVNCGDPLPPFVCRCPLMSLPYACGTTLETIPARVPYLFAPPDALQTAAALNWPATGLRVGVAWTGNPSHPKNHSRSVPLDLLETLFDLEDVHFFSLQMGAAAAELAARKVRITDLAPLTTDMADTAAQMMQMDLIISIDTSMAHLAGALGRPLWVLLSKVPDWRWLLDREDCPWYPTARLFRQPATNDWPSVIAKVRSELITLAEKKRQSEPPQPARALRMTPEQAVFLRAQLEPIQRHLDTGEIAEAEGLCLKILESDPRHAGALYLLGKAGFQSGRYEMAEKMMRRALAIHESEPLFLRALGDALKAQQKLDEAAACYREVLSLSPGEAEAGVNLGNILWEQGSWDEAIALYRQVVALHPENALAHGNLANAYQAQGKIEESLASYDRALALQPENAEAQRNRALLQLLQGNYAEGWRNYEWRHKLKTAPRSFPQPQWRGEPLKGARILLHSEQGLGDSLQFLRFVPLVQAAGGRVVLDLPARLHRLAAQLPNLAALVGRGDPMPPFDLHCPLMCLPLALQTTLESIPAKIPYLSVPAEARQSAAQINWPTGGLRVGLAWAGNAEHPANRRRSMALAQLEPLFKIENIHFFSLQLGPETAELADWKDRITDLAPETTDMADTAAQMAHLDLVITIDSSMAHLAGALARPVWVLLGYAPDWRWMLHREDSPWYPTARLFRQPKQGDWPAVIDRVRKALVELAAQPSM
jgi:tetratricopeptide (TPR) repeat protein